MLLREKKARTKWCPFVRVGGPVGNKGQGTSANRSPGQHPASDSDFLCLGSGCMAWRWKSELTRYVRTPSGMTPTLTKRVRGYCGLAGGVA